MVFSDTFNYTNGTRLNTVGWTEDLGTWQTSSNKATQTESTGGTKIVSRNVNISDLTISAEITTPSSGHFIMGIIWRYTDSTHFVEAELNSNYGGQGGFGLWYINGGIFIEIDRIPYSSFAPANNTTYTLRARVDGDSIVADILENGLQISGTCNLFEDITNVGVFEFRDVNRANPNLYNDFRVCRL